jgi:ATP-dependent Clp protease adaptor protein ClpS
MPIRRRCDVLLVNDDETPMAFVVTVLERFFGMSNLEAITHMGRIHEEGLAICGTYWSEQAEQKVSEVLAFALENHHPLKCILQEAD